MDIFVMCIACDPFLSDLIENTNGGNFATCINLEETLQIE
jgi:hypothetical protein